MPDAAPLRLRFPREMRLRESREFARIKISGHRLARGCLIANWERLPQGNHSRVGVITSRKIGKAHVRSRARRILRETFRQHQHDLLEPVAIVLIARASINGKSFADVERDFLSVIRQAQLLKKSV